MSMVRSVGRRWLVGTAMVAFAGVAACNAKGGREDYSQSPDSGAAAPATRIDTSMSRTYPDSTTGGPDRTGKRGVAGDTLGSRGRPAGTGIPTRDTTAKKP